jgi:V-type H+-transporting ATPase subunit H
MATGEQSFLASIQNNIRGRPISWEGAVRAKTITDADLKKIKSIDKVRKEQRKQTIEGDVDSFVTLLLGGNGSQSIFEAAAKRQDIIHYMLVLLADMIDGMWRVAYIHCEFRMTDYGQTYPLSQQLSSNTLRPTSHSYHS